MSYHQVGDKLGEGGFGSVYRATHYVTRQKYAIKFIDLSRYERTKHADLAFKEVRSLMSLSHPSIISLQNAFKLENKLVLFMELGGRSLRDYVYYHRFLGQKEARKIMLQLLQGVDYCHKKRIVHRDLKLENIVFSGGSNQAVKIIDFGIAGIFNSFQGEVTHVCTLRYAPPEIISKRNCEADPKIDVWSLGVVLYRILFGIFPFEGQNGRSLQKQVTQQELFFPDNHSARDLLKEMLQKNPKTRCGIWSVIQDPWMKGISEDGYESGHGENAEQMDTLQILKTESQRLTESPTFFKMHSRLEQAKASPQLKSGDVYLRKSMLLTGRESKVYRLKDQLGGKTRSTQPNTARTGANQAAISAAMGILSKPSSNYHSPQRRESSFQKKSSMSGSHEWKTATSRHLASGFKAQSLERKGSRSQFFSALSPIKEKKKQPSVLLPPLIEPENREKFKKAAAQSRDRFKVEMERCRNKNRRGSSQRNQGLKRQNTLQNNSNGGLRQQMSSFRLNIDHSAKKSKLTSILSKQLGLTLHTELSARDDSAGPRPMPRKSQLDERIAALSMSLEGGPRIPGHKLQRSLVSTMGRVMLPAGDMRKEWERVFCMKK